MLEYFDSIPCVCVYIFAILSLVVGRIMIPKMPVFHSPETVSMLDYVQRQIKVANGIKFAHQLTLTWGNYPGLSRKRKAEEETKVRQCKKGLAHCDWL